MERKKICHSDNINYSIDVNLLRLRGAFVGKYKTKEGDTQKCIVIPVDANFIRISDDENCANIDLVAIQKRVADKDTHFVQVKTNPVKIASGIKPPILGHLRPIVKNAAYERDEETDIVER